MEKHTKMRGHPASLPNRATLQEPSGKSSRDRVERPLLLCVSRFDEQTVLPLSGAQFSVSQTHLSTLQRFSVSHLPREQTSLVNAYATPAALEPATGDILSPLSSLQDQNDVFGTISVLSFTSLIKQHLGCYFHFAIQLFG